MIGMLVLLIALLVLMILGAIIALEAKNLLSAIISLGIVGFGLTLAFLILHAPDLAIVQIVVETLTLVILIAVILKTSREDTLEEWNGKRVFFYQMTAIFLVVFLFFLSPVLKHLPDFGSPIMRMSGPYLKEGLARTGAANLVASVILDFRAYDTLGEAAVLFTAVIGVVAVLRKIGRK